MGFPLPNLPASITDLAVKDFLEKYHQISKRGGANDDYASLFTSNGAFSMNGKKAKGTNEIRAFRSALLSQIPRRPPKPISFYTHGADQMHMMVHDVVSYKHHAGHETGGDWAAVVALAKEGGEVKMARYHIIVVSRMLL